MERRNILWVASYEKSEKSGAVIRSSLSVINTREEAILLFPGQERLHTVYEADFGVVIADIYYFDSIRNRKPHERVFIQSRLKR